MAQISKVAGQNAYITELLSLMWPELSDILSTDRKAQLMVALPNQRQPKLIIPRHPRRVAAAALHNYKVSMTGAEKVMKRGVSLGARVGLLELLPSRLRVFRSEEAIDTHLSSLLGVDVQVALYIGPPRAVQKAVLQVIDASGHTIAFAKLATNELTTSLVRREAETIQRLRESGLQNVRTPELLVHSTWRGAELVLQSAIQSGGSAARLRRLLPAATNELAHCFGSVSEPWISSRYRKRLYTRLEGLSQSGHTETLTQSLRFLDSEIAEVALEFGSWHGDWAPWNMTTLGPTVVAWDWEHFESGVPVGFDAIHYDISQLTLSGSSPAAAFRAVLKDPARTLAVALRSVELSPALVLLYALELASRYLQAGEDRISGTAMSRVGTWLPEVFAACRGALAEYG